jgi:hypothetical protein
MTPRFLLRLRYRRCPQCGHLAAVVTTGFGPAPLIAHIRRPLWIRHRGCPDTPVSGPARRIASRPVLEAPLAGWELAILAEVAGANVRADAYNAANGGTGETS